jgi:cytochrome c-type biogenesis protein
MSEVSVFLAFGAGLAGFFSPCILPILPAYLSFITGRTVEEIIKESPTAREILPSILLFCAGFSGVFVAMGATASALGQLMASNQRILEVVGGILVVILGLQQMGLVRISFLQREKRLHLRARPAHGLGGLIVGMAFGAGWTPCLGPILGAILTYASTKETVLQGVVLLGIFSLGMSLPFLALGLALGTILPRLRKTGPVVRWMGFGSGAILVALGILLIADQLSWLYRVLS